MARIKYYYDTESCRYERIKVSTWDIILNGLGFLTLGVMLAIATTFVYIRYFETPEETMLRKENEELLMYNQLQNKELDYLNNVLSSMQERDDNIYRLILGVDPVPEEMRKAGFGGAKRYKELMEQNLSKEELIIRNFEKIDELKKKMYIQTRSYDELTELARDKELMLASLPAIPPVSQKDLKRLSSGFGYRIDPIYKTRRLHSGVDFSLPIGSPVYATGDGTVTKVQSSIVGYGKHIEIDHGFGYTTKYAHLSEFEVKEGQKIKRGELIGKSGNSGKSTAPHLHYEVHSKGKAINPAHYFYMNISPEEYEEVLKLAAIENEAFGSYE